MTPRTGMLFEVALAACRVEAGYPQVVPTGGCRLAVHLDSQQVTENEAALVSEQLASFGHPIVLLATEKGFARSMVGLTA